MAITPTIAQGSLLFNLAFRPALFHIPPHPLHSPYPIKKPCISPAKRSKPDHCIKGSCPYGTDCKFTHKCAHCRSEHPLTSSHNKLYTTYRLQVRCLHDCILVSILSSPRAHKKKGEEKERVTLNSCCSTVDCGCVRNFHESVRIWPVERNVTSRKEHICDIYISARELSKGGMVFALRFLDKTHGQ